MPFETSHVIFWFISPWQYELYFSCHYLLLLFWTQRHLCFEDYKTLSQYKKKGRKNKKERKQKFFSLLTDIHKNKMSFPHLLWNNNYGNYTSYFRCWCQTEWPPLWIFQSISLNQTNPKYTYYRTFAYNNWKIIISIRNLFDTLSLHT